jgi:hypothetical protein|tara:strand:+ start:341 stop:469 length:129 start_codon:yes stop_codon:yes gene_type:complete
VLVEAVAAAVMQLFPSAAMEALAGMYKVLAAPLLEVEHLLEY